MIVIEKVSIKPDRIAIYNEYHPERSLEDSTGWANAAAQSLLAVDPESKPVAGMTDADFNQPGTDPEPETPAKKSTKQPNSNKAGRELSSKAQKRIQGKIEWLCLLSKRKKAYNPKSGKLFSFKVNFMTLTLPVLQQHSDTTIKSKCLNQFLIEARNHCNMRNYVWRAECQANGNVHFHIVSDTYLNAFLVRSIWNRCIGKMGYIDRYHEKFSGMTFPEYRKAVDPHGKKQYNVLLDRYQHGKKTNWRQPNTTDIHSTRRVRDLAAYMRKYMSKNIDPTANNSSAGVHVNISRNYQKWFSKQDSEKHQNHALEIDGNEYYSLKNRKISGRIWGCTQSLSKLNSMVTTICSEISTMLDNLIAGFPGKTYYFDYATCIFVRVGQYARNHLNIMKRMIGEAVANAKYRASTEQEQRYYLKTEYA